MKMIDLEREFDSGAGALLYVPETKKFLLILRSDLVSEPLTWCIPGGAVEYGEKPSHAAIRELKEETHIDLKGYNPQLLCTSEYHLPRYKFYTYGFIVNDEIKPKLNWESIDYGWFDVGELPSNLHYGAKQLFNNDRAAQKLKDFEKRQKNG